MQYETLQKSASDISSISDYIYTPTTKQSNKIRKLNYTYINFEHQIKSLHNFSLHLVKYL